MARPHKLAAGCVALALAAGPAVAAPIEITIHGGALLGVYQTTDRKMDYTLRLCGKDGKALCVELTAARGSALTPDTQVLIGTNVVREAKPIGKDSWRGSAVINGYTAYGTLDLTRGTSFVISACAMIVICDDFNLIPAK